MVVMSAPMPLAAQVPTFTLGPTTPVTVLPVSMSTSVETVDCAVLSENDQPSRGVSDGNEDRAGVAVIIVIVPDNGELREPRSVCVRRNVHPYVAQIEAVALDIDAAIGPGRAEPSE